jgi:prophage tail gpP-like protein
MTETQSAVRLLVNGQEFGGWKAVSITAGIERQARDFTLSVTDRWPGATDIPRRIRPGDVCEVFIGTDKVLTGYVDATPISYDAKQVSVGVRGRSKTADLVDCAAINEPGQWRNLKLERIAADLAKPYGITVKNETDTGAALADHQIDQGETVFESLDRMMRLRHVLSTDNENGELVFIDVGALSASTALVLGENIKSGSADLDFKDRFSEYRAKGQRTVAMDDDNDVAAAASESASAADTGVKRRRVIVFKQSGQADEGTCRDRVEYERGLRGAKSLAATYVVAGWRQDSGQLWKPNMMVRVHDSIIGFDQDMLISEVEYQLSESGTTASLKVAPKEGFLTKAAKAKKKDKSGSSWADVK